MPARTTAPLGAPLGAPDAALHVAVRLERGQFTLDVTLDVPDGEVLALVGPNASGKSTLLHAIAGLAGPQAGSVRVGVRLLTRRGEGNRVDVPPERRNIGLLGQDPLLFPHLSALENVAFGPRSAGVPAAAARGRARDWLDRVGLAEAVHRRPRALSGGQQQRVAIARALAAEPAVLLLDEPLAALDATAAPQIRQLLAEQLRATATTAVVVSHDVLDAVVLADRVAVMRAGRIVEQGPCAEVFAAPRTAFTAALVGVNLLPGTVDGPVVRTAVGVLRSDSDRGPDGEACLVRFRPSAVELHGERPAGANVWPARVLWLEPATGGVRVRLAGTPELLADLEPAAASREWLQPGAPVWVRVDPAAVHLTPEAHAGESDVRAASVRR